MNQVQIIDDVGEIRNALQEENRFLSEMVENITRLKQSYDSLQLSKDIRALQDASRIQNMSSNIRTLMLSELQRRKLIKQVLDGERI